MEEAGETLGPVIKQIEPTTKQVLLEKAPYQEQKEKHQGEKYDVAIVFGEGPVKDVRFLSELSSEEKTSWERFKNDPRHQNEPDYFVIDDSPNDNSPYFAELEEISKMDIPQEDKKILIETKRLEWQKMGRFSQKRWGEFNALAAGLSLYLGTTDKLILTGGRTVPKANEGSKQNWPSEAEMMRDIIIRRYGRLMFERDYPKLKDYSETQYQKYLETELKPRLIIEDEAETTPENVVYSVNKNPELFKSGNKIAIITNEHHLERASEFLHKFAGVSEVGQISAQGLLKERAEIRNKKGYQELMRFFTEEESNTDLQKRAASDKEKAERMKDPKRILYWFGYLGMLNDSQKVQTVISDLVKIEDTALRQRWLNALSQAFSKADIFYSAKPEDLEKSDNFYTIDIGELQKKGPAKFKQFKEKLSGLTVPEKRDIILDV